MGLHLNHRSHPSYIGLGRGHNRGIHSVATYGAAYKVESPIPVRWSNRLNCGVKLCRIFYSGVTVTANNAFESGRAEKRRVLEPYFPRRAAQRER